VTATVASRPGAADNLSLRDGAGASGASVAQVNETRLTKTAGLRAPDVVFIPSPERVVEEMLALADPNLDEIIHYGRMLMSGLVIG
jgi:hypothetical protein